MSLSLAERYVRRQMDCRICGDSIEIYPINEAPTKSSNSSPYTPTVLPSNDVEGIPSSHPSLLSSFSKDRQIEGVNQLSPYTICAYVCSQNKNHCVCISCFIQYIEARCSRWQYLGVPVVCPCDCPIFIPDNDIRSILGDKRNHSLKTFDLYEKSVLQAGLMDAQRKGGGVAVHCIHCHYVALLPNNYRERAIRLKQLEENGEMNNNQKEVNSGKEEKNIVDDIPLTKLSRQISDGVSLTSLFFECPTTNCHTRMCLICDKFIRPNSNTNAAANISSPPSELSLTSAHLKTCAISAEQIMYQKIIGVLAEASAQRCPSCSYRGAKDENCCHITCVNCGTRWCYVCEKSESSVGGFGSHNQWNLTYAEDSNRCPQYLDRMWMGGAINSTGDQTFSASNAGLSLKRFHLNKQINAIHQLYNSLHEKEKQIFLNTEKMFFGGNIFSDDERKEIEQIKTERNDYRIMAEEIRKKKEEERILHEEEERRKAEIAARLAEERRRIRLAAKRERRKLAEKKKKAINRIQKNRWKEIQKIQSGEKQNDEKKETKKRILLSYAIIAEGNKQKIDEEEKKSLMEKYFPPITEKDIEETIKLMESEEQQNQQRRKAKQEKYNNNNHPNHGHTKQSAAAASSIGEELKESKEEKEEKEGKENESIPTEKIKRKRKKKKKKQADTATIDLASAASSIVNVNAWGSEEQ